MKIGMPDPGYGRFWHGVHQPNNTKSPLTLELRQKIAPGNKAIVVTMSTLVAKQGTIADEEAVIRTANEILVRASRVEAFTGILQ